MKTLIFILTFLTFTSTPTLSQEKGKKILERVAENTRNMGAVKILFTYSMTNEEQGINESYEGELLSKGEKYRLKITGQEVYSNGETIWTYIPDAMEVQVSTAEQGSGGFNPTSVLTDYEDKFEVKLLEEKTIENREVAILKLTPKKEEQFKKAHIVIDKAKDELLSLTIFDEIGNEFTYKVEELLPNIGLQGNEFKFDESQHPDVDVIDMR